MSRAYVLVASVELLEKIVAPLSEDRLPDMRLLLHPFPFHIPGKSPSESTLWATANPLAVANLQLPYCVVLCQRPLQQLLNINESISLPDPLPDAFCLAEFAAAVPDTQFHPLVSSATSNATSPPRPHLSFGISPEEQSPNIDAGDFFRNLVKK